MSKFQIFAVYASLVCWCVLIGCFFIALAIRQSYLIFDYVAAGGVIGGITFFSLAIIFNKEGEK